MQNKLHIYPTLTVLSYLTFREAFAMALLNHSSQEFVSNKIGLIFKDTIYTLKVNEKNTSYFLKYSENILKNVKEIQLIFFSQTLIEQIFLILEDIEIQLTGKKFSNTLLRASLLQLQSYKKQQKTQQAEINSIQTQNIKDNYGKIEYQKRTMVLSLNIIDSTTLDKFDTRIIKDKKDKLMIQNVLKLLSISNQNQQITSFQIKKIVLTDFDYCSKIKNLNILNILDCKELELNNSKVFITHPNFQFKNLKKLSLSNDSELMPTENIFLGLKHLEASDSDLFLMHHKYPDIETLVINETEEYENCNFKFGPNQKKSFPYLKSVKIDNQQFRKSLYLDVYQKLQELTVLPQFQYIFRGFIYEFRQLSIMLKMWPENCKYILQIVQSDNLHKAGSYKFTFDKDFYEDITVEEMLEYQIQMKQNKYQDQKIYLKSQSGSYSLMSNKEHQQQGNYNYRIKLTVIKYYDIAKYKMKYHEQKEKILLKEAKKCRVKNQKLKK